MTCRHNCEKVNLLEDHIGEDLHNTGVDKVLLNEIQEILTIGKNGQIMYFIKSFLFIKDMKRRKNQAKEVEENICHIKGKR